MPITHSVSPLFDLFYTDIALFVVGDAIRISVVVYLVGGFDDLSVSA